jgi:hypothetical protein
MDLHDWSREFESSFLFSSLLRMFAALAASPFVAAAGLSDSVQYWRHQAEEVSGHIQFFFFAQTPRLHTAGCTDRHASDFWFPSSLVVLVLFTSSLPDLLASSKHNTTRPSLVMEPGN